ncbi:MAG TPA: four helix bundle protein [Bdellovibrionota bacterium]|nr:four helix bundle protein [Bdellovibrionota bacterium]
MLAKDFYRDCQRIRCASHVRDQLWRASLSVVNNLCEGSAKPSPKERARFYSIALASFRECQGMLDLLNEREMLRRYDFLGICLFNLRRYTLAPRARAPGS